ncbi:MAG: DDE transposase family protein [Chitinophagaceae bacterium]|nr:MAG: DDE transposase family protein [Chitinophagaceae bacterium]
MKELTIKQKKEWAKLLFIRETGMTQKIIAAKVGTSEKTLSQWATKEHWDNLRKSLLVTKEEQLHRLYNQLDALNHLIEENKGYANSKEADTIVKLTSAIRNLETETSIAEVFEAGKKFITWVQQNDFSKAKELVELYDGFIKNQLKQY